ncbi:MAG: hypothetical protein CVU48_03230 [Candidatus Cloacimonetes bacterium HGW-Cloacimonetes-1]|jgi:predicted dithiol-disulfide oxidoreductase (DUF899 family)|nr:MAG: hypothetical protein CVU48_03230 [Candidatus Cloacimonetes bacterium HGW-Cloacimonetes-1]
MTDTKAITDKISSLEQEIIRKKTELYDLKKTLPRFEVQNYTLIDRDGKPITLLDLFGNKSEMILVHNMGHFCPYCTLWADGFKGMYHHLEDRAAFVVSTPDSPDVMKKFADSRAWDFTVVSTQGSTLKPDLGFQLADGSYYPGVSTLQKSADGKIYHIAKAFFGPGDDFCALWYFFDMLPTENPEWEPKFQY